MELKTSKGFTLTELLIVMAIVVVLAAVAIPTFSRQLETSRETNDMEIIRNAYTEALSVAVQDGTDGILNGKIGDSSTTTAEAATATFGAVSFQGGDAATYTVTVSGLQNAKFKQNGTAVALAASDNSTAAGTWANVTGTLMGLKVPPVNTLTTNLKFTFAINANGEVGVVAVKMLGETTTASYLFEPSA